MYHTLWLYACSNGARLVCNHANIQRRVGGCIYSLFLSAAISHFIYRRRMGRPIPQEKIDYRRRSADCICHFRNGIGNSAASEYDAKLKAALDEIEKKAQAVSDTLDEQSTWWLFSMMTARL